MGNEASSPTPGSSKPSGLLQVTRDRLRLKHYSLRTERSCLAWIRRFIRLYPARHPRGMGVTEIEVFRIRLVAGRAVLPPGAKL